MTTEEEINNLRALRGAALERDVLKRKWYVQPNDLVGGHCIMPIDEPPGSGVFMIADTMSESIAKHIVELHNAEIHEHEWVQTAGLTVGDVYTCTRCGVDEVRHYKLEEKSE